MWLRQQDFLIYDSSPCHPSAGLQPKQYGLKQIAKLVSQEQETHRRAPGQPYLETPQPPAARSFETARSSSCSKVRELSSLRLVAAQSGAVHSALLLGHFELTCGSHNGLPGADSQCAEVGSVADRQSWATRQEII